MIVLSFPADNLLIKISITLLNSTANLSIHEPFEKTAQKAAYLPPHQSNQLISSLSVYKQFLFECYNEVFS